MSDRRASRTGGSAHGFLLRAGFALLFGGFLVGRSTDDAGGLARWLGLAGMAALALFALVAGIDLFRSSDPGSLPDAVGRRRIAASTRLRVGMLVTLALAVGLPVGAALAFLIAVREGWLWLGFGLLLGVACLAIVSKIERRRTSGGTKARIESWPEAAVLLERLCIRADLPVPNLVAEDTAVATAWTSAGRIHLTVPLLELLDTPELEGVLAHELAHLAHRDAAIMDVASAPSRLLLGTVTVFWHPSLVPDANWRAKAGLVMFGLIYGPPAFVLGWVSRFSVLGLSRAREFSADAAASTLTGQPAALASALLKLEHPHPRVPRADLRLVARNGVLSIVEIDASRFGRLLRTHPSVAARVKRLEAMEQRLQAGT